MTEPSAGFRPGNYVAARGREWLVLPESSDDLLILRPLGGLDEEITGILPSLENVEAASFSLPNPDQPGDFHACRLLRDAARLTNRDAAGPFRSFARIAIQPRPYQLVPLLMAMRLDPVRLLIADDVGIGKTIEAALIVRELLDRGEVERFAVLCPPHLAEQWQKELLEKFHLEAELVLSSTVKRLERGLPPSVSLFDHHRYVVVSTDFIKSPRRRDDFLRACPELVVVDEAHTCTIADLPGRARQERHQLLSQLAADGERHLVLVTATPHSGNEAAFRSLLSLIDEQFHELPAELEGPERADIRRDLARHLIQRRRANIRSYLGTETVFPDRLDKEASYQLTPEYAALFKRVLAFAQEIALDESGGRRQQRVNWWSALSLLRSLSSSPRAAAATLRNRATTAASDSVEEADELGRRVVLDQDDADSEEVFDITPGADTTEGGDEKSTTRPRLLSFAQEAEKLAGRKDAKLQGAIELVSELQNLGHSPIFFCRFIDTADYLAEELRKAYPDTEVSSVTGILPPKERENRVESLGEHQSRVLVCTDCLSEGVNLQDHFDAVVHYDLSWNPTRHEQREGRVDRFGQDRSEIRVVTYFGTDTQIDGVVLDVLLRKHKQIRNDLGISVAVPGKTESVIEALFEGLLLRENTDQQIKLKVWEEHVATQRETVHQEWTDAAEREKKSRSIFAQKSIKPEEVAQEWEAVQSAIGDASTVEEFVLDTLHLAGIPVARKANTIEVNLTKEAPRGLRQAIGQAKPFRGRFDLPVEDGVHYLSRTHPIVEGMASYCLEMALDDVSAEGESPIARRCGVLQTEDVQTKTTVLLARLRYYLEVRSRGREGRSLLASEVVPLAFEGPLRDPGWLLDDESIRSILTARPSANVAASLARDQLTRLISGLEELQTYLDDLSEVRARAVRDAHTRVRSSARLTGRVDVGPVDTPDILGCFILLPANQAQTHS